MLQIKNEYLGGFIAGVLLLQGFVEVMRGEWFRATLFFLGTVAALCWIADEIKLSDYRIILGRRI